MYQILSDLPRKQCALILGIVLANLGSMALLQARRVAEERYPGWWTRAEAQRFEEEHPDCEVIGPFRPELVGPWSWSTAEWRETVCPWM